MCVCVVDVCVLVEKDMQNVKFMQRILGFVRKRGFVGFVGINGFLDC